MHELDQMNMKIMKAVILTNDYEPNEDVKCKE